MVSFANAVSFVAASSGTGAFVPASARASFRTPAQAQSDGDLIVGNSYSYFAVNKASAPTQREWGNTVWNGTNFTRVVLGGISGGSDTGTSPITFDAPPTVDITLLAADVRTKLTGHTTYNVSKTGSDSNPGTSALPWLTPQHAVDWLAANIDAAGFCVMVQFGDGTYAGPVVSGFPLNCPGVAFIGNSANQLAVKFDTTGTGFSCCDFEAGFLGVFDFLHITFALAKDSGDGVTLDSNYMYVEFCDCGWDAGAHAGADAIGLYNQGASVLFGFSNVASLAGFAVPNQKNFTIKGSWIDFITAANAYCLTLFVGGVFTLTGTPSWSSGFFRTVSFAGDWVIMHTQGGLPSFVGTATGSKAFIIAPGFADFDLTLFPGNSEATYLSPGIFIPGLLGRSSVTADRTYFVATTGSDSNDGLTVGTPFATIGHACAVVEFLDFVGPHALQIKVADGNYPEDVILPNVSGFNDSENAQPLLLGNSANPQNVTVRSLTVGNFFPASWEINGFSIGTNGFNVFAGGYAITENIQIDVQAHATIGQFATWQPNGVITLTNSGGSATQFITAYLGSQIIPVGVVTITLAAPTTVTSALFVMTESTVSAFIGSFAISGSLTGALLNLTNNSHYGGTLSGGTSLGTIDNTSSYNGAFGVLSKAGLPANTDIAAGTHAVFKDTSGGGVYLAYNDAGTIKKVALT